MFSRLNTDHECDRRTDEQTNWSQHNHPCIALRDKKLSKYAHL